MIRLPALPLAALAALVLGLVLAPGASADSSESSNWAGYAAHHSGVHFKRVVGTWTQPKATCVPGQPTYSSMWIGIGGYAVSSPALEQIGTEADCTAAGRQSSSAWFELVPAPSKNIKLAVSPGNRLQASVAISGRQVTLTLDNLTRHRSFTRRVRASVLDTGSAEWIVEAPSVCSTSTACQTLPLADFGTTGFSAARATMTTGHVGTIHDRRWTTTKITLAQSGRRFIDNGGSAPATATPSALKRSDTAFTVTYGGASGGSPTAERRQVATTRLVHRRALSPRS